MLFRDVFWRTSMKLPLDLALLISTIRVISCSRHPKLWRYQKWLERNILIYNFQKLINTQKYFASSRRHDFNQNICSYLHLETCWQEKAGHTNNHAEKSSERELITSCCGCSYLLLLFFVTWKFKWKNLLKINLQNLKVENFSGKILMNDLR